MSWYRTATLHSTVVALNPSIARRRSHGVVRSLHDEPSQIPTSYEKHDCRRITEGQVFTIEPFLSLGADHVEEMDDGWTLRPPGHEATVQYEHTLVATRRGPLILTLA